MTSNFTMEQFLSNHRFALSNHVLLRLYECLKYKYIYFYVAGDDDIYIIR